MTDVNAYYAQLVGAEITAFRLIPDALGEDPWPTFTVKMPGGDVMEIQLSRDPEGNGGGFAFIAPPSTSG